MAPRNIVIVAYPGVQSLDVTGPVEVFSGANRVFATRGDPVPYDIRIVADPPGPVTTGSGITLLAEPLPGRRVVVDTLVLAGGDGVDRARRSPELLDFVADRASRSRRVATVCSGALLAAAAGLLDGRRVTTHWARASELAREFPAVEVDADPIYVRDGDVWTSAGVTAGIDLALALVEDDLGTTVAQLIARWLVMFLHRPGGQTQFATPVWTPRAARSPVRDAQARVESAPGDDHRVATLARTAAMSERHFTRVFTAEVGETPSRWVERVAHRGRPARTRVDQRHPRRDRHPLRVRHGRDPPPGVPPPPADQSRRLPAAVRRPHPRQEHAMTDPAPRATTVAIPLFDRFTALDAVGPYEVLQRIPGFDVVFLGHERGEVRSDNGMLGIVRDATFEEVSSPDVLVVPGGVGTRDLVTDDRVLDWVRGVHATSTWTTSVCTGSMVLAAAVCSRGSPPPRTGRPGTSWQRSVPCRWTGGWSSTPTSGS